MLDRREGVNSFYKLLHRKSFHHPSDTDNNKTFMQDKFFTSVPRSTRGQWGFTHDPTRRPRISDEAFSSRSVRLFLDRRSGCYLLMLMMWPSSTFRSFIDLYASRVQIDRAKTFTCRGRGGQARFGFSWTLSLVEIKAGVEARGESLNVRLPA